MMAPPDAAAGKLIEPDGQPAKTVTSARATGNAHSDRRGGDGDQLPNLQRTEFGVDVGGANSVGGLRALWRGLSEIEIECAACGVAADHRGEGKHRRPRHAATAGRRTARAMRRRRRKSAPAWSTTTGPARPPCSTASALSLHADEPPRRRAGAPNRHRQAIRPLARHRKAGGGRGAAKTGTATTFSSFSRGSRSSYARVASCLGPDFDVFADVQPRRLVPPRIPNHIRRNEKRSRSG